MSLVAALALLAGLAFLAVALFLKVATLAGAVYAALAVGGPSFWCRLLLCWFCGLAGLPS